MTKVSHPAPIVHRFNWTIPVTIGAAAIVVLAVGSQFLGPPQPQPARGTSEAVDPGHRIKGHDLALFRKTAEGSEVLGDEARVRVGDLIRIGYRAADRSYGVILSIDGRGGVTRHLPRHGDRAAPLGQDGQVLLDHAYELDDAPLWERFYFVAGRELFDVAPVMEAARRLAAGVGVRPPGALSLPAPLEQSSLVLIKVTEPGGQAAMPEVGGPRLRPLSPVAARLIDEARARSATVLDLERQLLSSDIVVYVDSNWRPDSGSDADLRWMAETGGLRYVMVRVATKLPLHRRIELVGHELRHALEIAAAPWVRGIPDVRTLFQQIGRRTSSEGAHETFETAAALAAELHVRRDLRTRAAPTNATASVGARRSGSRW